MGGMPKWGAVDLLCRYPLQIITYYAAIPRKLLNSPILEPQLRPLCHILGYSNHSRLMLINFQLVSQEIIHHLELKASFKTSCLSKSSTDTILFR